MLPFIKQTVVLLFFLFIGQPSLFSQELFPLTEPASNVPKGVVGIRLMGETYKEQRQYKNQYSIRVMYGALPRLSVITTIGISNHHGKHFPANLISHTHDGTKTIYTTGEFQRGLKYAYRSNGIHLYAKYRFISVDAQNSHLRVAAYGEGAYVNQAHDEAEPNFMGDTKGMGGGLIATCLKNHFAVSLTSGIILPGAYSGLSPDENGGPMIPTKMKYGRAVIYNLSMGYLLIPHTYKTYDQLNVNVYVEFLGKAYEAATIQQYGTIDIPISTPLLKAGNYVDIAPAFNVLLNQIYGLIYHYNIHSYTGRMHAFTRWSSWRCSGIFIVRRNPLPLKTDRAQPDRFP